MTLEAVKIPQNVYIEDRIIGPVTLRQLIICGIGAGFSYAIFSMASKAGSLGIPLTIVLWLPAAIAAAFAFVKVNDLSLFNIILLIIEHANKPNVRYWNPHPGISINFVTSSARANTDTNQLLVENSVKLTELTRQLEKREQEVSRLANAGNRRTNEFVLASEQESSPLPRTDTLSAMPQTQTPEVQPVLEKPVALAVQTQRVQAQGLDPTLSIDGVNGGLKAYTHLFQNP